MISPAQSIKAECKWCMGGTRGMKCDSEVCKLNNKSLSHLKRIKAHCLDCVETREDVKKCTGKLLFEDRLCYLHPYRFGKSGRKGKKGTPAHLVGHLFQKTTVTKCVSGELETIPNGFCVV